MRKAQKGFTLVELIVVITILAILGTIAFISLQGYSQDAKNSKVTSDLSTMTSAIEVGLTDGRLDSISDVVATDATLTTNHSVTGTYGSGLTLGTDGTYTVGTIDFGNLRQNGADFKDNDGNDYVAAVATRASTGVGVETFAFYQVAGEVKDATGAYSAIVKGNYVEIIASDADGLISETGQTTWLTNKQAITSTSMYD